MKRPPTPLPVHEFTIGHVRVSVHCRTPDKPTPDARVTFERRHDTKRDEWYPVASFLLADLDALVQALSEVRHNPFGDEAVRQVRNEVKSPPAPGATDHRPVDATNPSTARAATPTPPRPESPAVTMPPGQSTSARGHPHANGTALPPASTASSDAKHAKAIARSSTPPQAASGHVPPNNAKKPASTPKTSMRARKVVIARAARGGRSR